MIEQPSENNKLTDNARLLGVGVVEQDTVSNLHQILHQVLGLMVSLTDCSGYCKTFKHEI